jgi:pyruvate-formate lyase-activating enzyme
MIPSRPPPLVDGGGPQHPASQARLLQARRLAFTPHGCKVGCNWCAGGRRAARLALRLAHVVDTRA